MGVENSLINRYLDVIENSTRNRYIYITQNNAQKNTAPTYIKTYIQKNRSYFFVYTFWVLYTETRSALSLLALCACCYLIN